MELPFREDLRQAIMSTDANLVYCCSMAAEQAGSEIRTSIQEADESVLQDILNFNLGPKASSAKTYLYFSIENTDGPGSVEYSIIASERATEILVETGGTSAIKSLYTSVCSINNPAFLGCVSEVDYFARCSTITLKLRKKDTTSAAAAEKVSCPTKPRELAPS
jgi:hypothetical protein